MNRELYAAHAKSLQQRYEQALAARGFDTVVIHSGSPKKRSEFDDQFFPLRPTPHFQHWVALEEADCAIVVRMGRKPLLVWPVVDSFWERPREPALGHLGDALEVIRPKSHKAVQDHLQGKTAFIGETGKMAAEWGIDSVNPEALTRDLDELRVHKSDFEVACIDEANRISSLGHQAVFEAFQGGVFSELELHLLYLKATAQDDPDTPYKNIVALGHNGATLHHVSYGRSKVDAASLLVDAGAVHLGYCSDITRTWVKGHGALAGTFRGMVEGLEKAQLRLCDQAKAGLMYETLHEDAHREIATILKDAGVASGSTEAIATTGISRAFFPHGLGHSLGLQCHDVGCALVKPKTANSALRHTRQIEERQCFTVEPGIYFIDGLLGALREKPEGKDVDWKLVEGLAAFGGIRIEDDLVVFGGTTKNLTRPLLPRGGGAA